MRENFMKVKGTVMAVALGALLVCGVSVLGVTSAHAAAPTKLAKKLTRAEGLPLQAAQKAIKAHKYPEALAALAKAEAVPGTKKNPWAQHLVNALYAMVYQSMHDYAKLAPRIEAMRKDPFATPGEVKSWTVSLAQMYYELHNYPKAIQYGTEAIKSGAGGAQMPTLVGQAYYLQGNWKQTIAFERGLIDSAIRSGAKPSKQALQLVQSSCLKLHDNTCLLNSLEQLVVYYPQRNYWQYLLYQTFKSIKNDANLLEAYRLAFAVDVMQEPHEFTSYAELAIEAGSPGEAEQVLTSALNHNVFTSANAKAKAKRILADAQKRAASDKRSLKRTAALAAKQSTGNSDIRVGLAYLGYQQYPEAIKEFTQGIAKGGLTKTAEAHLLLGIAQLKAGHKQAAVAAFKQVKGEPTLQRLAALWTLKARSVG